MGLENAMKPFSWVIFMGFATFHSNFIGEKTSSEIEELTLSFHQERELARHSCHQSCSPNNLQRTLLDPHHANNFFLQAYPFRLVRLSAVQQSQEEGSDKQSPQRRVGIKIPTSKEVSMRFIHHIMEQSDSDWSEWVNHGTRFIYWVPIWQRVQGLEVCMHFGEHSTFGV